MSDLLFSWMTHPSHCKRSSFGQMITAKRIHHLVILRTNLVSYHYKICIRLNIICVQLLCLHSDRLLCDVCGSASSVGVDHEEGIHVIRDKVYLCSPTRYTTFVMVEYLFTICLIDHVRNEEVSMSRGISYVKYENGRLTGLVTSYVETAF